MKCLLSLTALLVVCAADNQCCKTDIAVSSDRALFNPPIHSCRPTTHYICSASDANQSTPTKIVINGKTTVATGPAGMTSFAELSCRQSDKQWTTKEQVVNTISCE